MPTLHIVKRVNGLGADLEHLGARLDLVVDVGESATSESSSSVEVPELSSSSGQPAVGDYGALFLYRREDGDDYFLDICSPADLETWPVDEPEAADGLYRTNYVSLTFRSEQVLDDAYGELWSRINALADALTVLNKLREQEDVEYDFSPAAAAGSSSSGSYRKFTLTRAPVSLWPESSPVGYRLHVSCSAEGADEAIFLWRNDLPDREGIVRKRPIAVCSPGDLVDYPEASPSARQFPDHYRLDTWDIVSARVQLIDETWAKMKADVAQLARALKSHSGDAYELETLEKHYDA